MGYKLDEWILNIHTTSKVWMNEDLGQASKKKKGNDSTDHKGGQAPGSQLCNR